MADKLILTWKTGNNPPTETSPGNDEWTFSRGYVFGEYHDSIDAYEALVTEAQKDFPELQRSDIHCARVRESSWQKNFIFVHFPLPANTVHSLYRSGSKPDFGY